MYARIYCIYHACMPVPSSSIMPGFCGRDTGHKGPYALCQNILMRGPIIYPSRLVIRPQVGKQCDNEIETSWKFENPELWWVPSPPVAAPNQGSRRVGSRGSGEGSEWTCD